MVSKHKYTGTLDLLCYFIAWAADNTMFWSWTVHGNTSGKNYIYVTEQSVIDFLQAPEENLHG